MPTDTQKTAALAALTRQCPRCRHKWVQRIARPTRCPHCFIPIDAWEAKPRRAVVTPVSPASEPKLPDVTSVTPKVPA